MRRELRQLLTLAVLVAAATALVPARAEAQNQGKVGAGQQNQGMVSAADMQRAQAAYQADLQRQAIARDKPAFVAALISRWSAEIGNGEKGRPELETAFLAANPEKLLKMSQAETWDAVVAIALGFDPTNFGGQTNDLVFTPLTPCRVFDSRSGTGVWAGPYASGTTVSIFVSDPLNPGIRNQGGATNCGFPLAVGTAAALNITVVPTVGSVSGDLNIYPFGAAAPNASIINFYPGVNLANATSAQIALTSLVNDLTIKVEFASSVHIIVDIMGYYAAPNTAALQNIRVNSVTTSWANGTFPSVNSPVCPAGYTLVSGGFNWGGPNNTGYNVFENDAGDNPPTYWRFFGFNGTGATVNLIVYGNCARTPGR